MSDFLRDFSDSNRVVIYFVYGQVFFVLGLILTLQSWRHTRLALARSLKWLAAFGIVHGLHEWGHVFIPLQAEYLPPPLIEALLGLQLILLAVSFVCLFQFGIETLRPLPNRQRLLRYLPGLVLAVWVFMTFGPTLTRRETIEGWYTLNSILARYGMGLPAGLLAAYGLRRQAQQLVAPLQVPHIWHKLRVAGLALAAYSIMAGLVVSPADFFPANLINTTELQRLTLIPVEIYRSLIGLILIFAIIRALEVFRVELDRQLTTLEERQMLVTERERIGRELHDGTLQMIYAVGLLLKTSEKEMTQQASSPKSLSLVQQAITLLDQAVVEIRSYIGVLRAQSDSRSLASGLQELASTRHLRSMLEVELQLDLPDQRPLAPARVGHLLAIASEGLSNVVRHAQATQVRLAATATNGRLRLEIQDNGNGLPIDYVIGYGLTNMRERARILGGELAVDTKPGQGTLVLVEVPWSEADETPLEQEPKGKR